MIAAAAKTNIATAPGAFTDVVPVRTQYALALLSGTSTTSPVAGDVIVFWVSCSTAEIPRMCHTPSNTLPGSKAESRNDRAAGEGCLNMSVLN